MATCAMVGCCACPSKSYSPAVGLGANGSKRLFEALGGLYKTGPTMTEVCDLHMLQVEERPLLPSQHKEAESPVSGSS